VDILFWRIGCTQYLLFLLFFCRRYKAEIRSNAAALCFFHTQTLYSTCWFSKNLACILSPQACVNAENRRHATFTQERAHCATQSKLCLNGNSLSLCACWIVPSRAPVEISLKSRDSITVNYTIPTLTSYTEKLVKKCTIPSLTTYKLQSKDAGRFKSRLTIAKQITTTQRLFTNYNQICQVQGNRNCIVW